MKRDPQTIGQIGSKVFLISREEDSKGVRLVCATSPNGKKFSKKVQKISIKDDKWEEDITKCSDFKLTSPSKEVFLTYLRNSSRGSTLVVARGSSVKSFKVISSVKLGGPGVYMRLGAKAGAVYYGRDVLRVSSTKNLKRWSTSEGQRGARWRFFEGLPFEIAGTYTSKSGNFVFCGACLSEEVMGDLGYGSKVGEVGICRLGVAHFRHDHPNELEWQTELPFMDLPVKGAHGKVTFLGITSSGVGKRKVLRAFVSVGGKILIFEFPEAILHDRNAYVPMLLARSQHNPIMHPSDHAWERQSVFNPTALKIDGSVHFLYRAIGDDGISRLGYAFSRDGLQVDKRLSLPALALTDPRSSDTEHRHFDQIMYPSGGSWGGVEDPRLTMIDEKVYVTFNMFDGWDNMRVGVIWMKLEDFLAKKFWKWSKPIYLSPPKQVHKNWILFPEKVDGKFAILHSISPKVEVEYRDSIEDIGKKTPFIKSWEGPRNGRPPRLGVWDTYLRGAGPPPLKTKAGWLVFYHALEKHEPSRYKLGALLLDLNNPNKILHRAKASLLNPDMWYENQGKPGIVYACGAVEMGDTLYVYYGGADRVSCVATIKTEELLAHIIKGGNNPFKIIHASF